MRIHSKRNQEGLPKIKIISREAPPINAAKEGGGDEDLPEIILEDTPKVIELGPPADESSSVKKSPHKVFGWKKEKPQPKVKEQPKPERNAGEQAAMDPEDKVVVPETAGNEIPEMADEEGLEAPRMEIDWQEEAMSSESISELASNLESAVSFNGQNGSELAKKIKAAESFLQANMALIVEGVLNTTDDIRLQEGYVEGSNLEVRSRLGEFVKALGDAKLEEKAKALMKKEMAGYFNGHKMELAEAAVKHAPSAASIFEVVKRFKQIKDGQTVYSREELKGIMADNLAFDRELDVYAAAHNRPDTAVDAGVIDNLQEQIAVHAGRLPEVMGIRRETADKFRQKLIEIKVKKLAQEISSGVSSDEEAPKKGGFFAAVKSGWGKLWGRK